MLHLAFETRELRDACEHPEFAEERYGPDIGDLLIRRLADLRALPTVLQLIAGNPRFYRDKSQDYISISLADGFQLILVQNHPIPPLLENGQLNWAQVIRLRVVGIQRDAC